LEKKLIFAALFKHNENYSTMPKLKTHSSAKKRFKVTGSGLISRSRSGKRHILTKKTKKRKLRLGHAALVHTSDQKRVERMLGYGG
jgi:large subunit ribosomal protein L35